MPINLLVQYLLHSVRKYAYARCQREEQHDRNAFRQCSRDATHKNVHASNINAGRHQHTPNHYHKHTDHLCWLLCSSAHALN